MFICRFPSQKLKCWEIKISITALSQNLTYFSSCRTFLDKQFRQVFFEENTIAVIMSLQGSPQNCGMGETHFV